MTFLPHTEEDRQAMLDVIGVPRLEALFDGIPAHLRFPDLDLPAACSEMEITTEMHDLAGRNAAVDPASCFLGAGTYRHFIPAAVDYVVQRGELYTAYTPYQPELSQGVLQALFEYQSMICRLTAMEVSNASHYDGATSLAEGVLLALDAAAGKKRRILLAPGLHPEYRQVLETYLRGFEATVADVQAGAEIGEQLDTDVAALVVQQPDFYGQFHPTEGLAEAVHRAGALLVVVVDPISLGLFQPPGAWGADVVVAEGQPLGIPMSFGGPHLGIFATRKQYVRRMAGRVVGETQDAVGARGYVLTLATREQHIRREKATSNICTNATLCALAAATYLATLGKTGLAQVARLCYEKSHYLAGEFEGRLGFEINPHAPPRPFFKEFVVRLPRPVCEVNEILLHDHRIMGGLDLGQHDERFENHMLVVVTEMNTRAAMDRLVDALESITR